MWLTLEQLLHPALEGPQEEEGDDCTPGWMTKAPLPVLTEDSQLLYALLDLAPGGGTVSSRRFRRPTRCSSIQMGTGVPSKETC